ncbi:hypothetical protein HYC85_009027 [Camellia sinensis]|uniref:Uncharacterized protein n=1 Tax=Camellia sinensis TaxID=4442 RepID=A0A7J7HVB1_CAMSI|nr:hypothetical protein HYC85_009027 [Camellia sinensis]
MGSPNRFMASETRFKSYPYRRDDFTPTSASNLGSQSEPQLGTTIGTGVQPTPDLAASTGALGSELETLMTFLGERLGFENTGLLNITEVMNSAKADTRVPYTRPHRQPAVTQPIQHPRSVPKAVEAYTYTANQHNRCRPTEELPSSRLPPKKTPSDAFHQATGESFCKTTLQPEKEPALTCIAFEQHSMSNCNVAFQTAAETEDRACWR